MIQFHLLHFWPTMKTTGFTGIVLAVRRFFFFITLHLISDFHFVELCKDQLMHFVPFNKVISLSSDLDFNVSHW